MKTVYSVDNVYSCCPRDEEITWENKGEWGTVVETLGVYKTFEQARKRFMREIMNKTQSGYRKVSWDGYINSDSRDSFNKYWEAMFLLQSPRDREWEMLVINKTKLYD